MLPGRIEALASILMPTAHLWFFVSVPVFIFYKIILFHGETAFMGYLYFNKLVVHHRTHLLMFSNTGNPMEFSNIITVLTSLCQVGAPLHSLHLLCPVSFVSTLSLHKKESGSKLRSCIWLKELLKIGIESEGAQILVSFVSPILFLSTCFKFLCLFFFFFGYF